MSEIDHKIATEIKNELDKTHIKYRIFSRIKNEDSIKEKIIRKNYSVSTNHLQDFIGIRITTYFVDDIDIVQKVLEHNYSIDNSAIDDVDADTFRPIRRNLVFALPNEYIDLFKSYLGENSDIVDPTFEVQIRTIFSEGWHEIEHDYHYKKITDTDDWDKYTIRKLNSINATLELCEQNLCMVLKECSRDFLLSKRYDASFYNSLRIDISRQPFPDDILQTIEAKPELLEKVISLDRKNFITTLYESHVLFPMSLVNYFLAASLFVGINEFRAFEPRVIKNDLDKYAKYLDGYNLIESKNSDNTV